MWRRCWEQIWRGDAVVIKTASDALLSKGARMRLEHEGAVLCQIQTPEVSPLRGLGREGNQVYLVMALIPGVRLRTRLSRVPLSIGETLVAARCLLSALGEVHARGVLHRDVKPANLMVDENVPLQRATLIDFGLSRSAQLDASMRDQLVGTLLYMSPEQAGLLDREVDERSDLYSAGIVLFECLAGRPPFQADNVGDLLRQHLTARPPELRSPAGRIPRALDELVQRLLRKDPLDRYQSAEAVLADLQAISDGLDRGVADPPVVIGLHDRRRTLAEPAFVGRGGELAALESQLESARAGSGGLVLVEAESGGGKTRLLDELAQRAARLGVRVLSGQGLDQAAQRPFQVLTGLAKRLITAARRRPGLAEAIRERLGDQRPAVVAALPEMAEILGSDAPDLLGPETFGETRSLQALASLIDALSDASSPTLVLLDDCQWADDLTLKLLSYWQRRHDSRGFPDRHLLAVVAFRTEEVSASHYLRTLQKAAHLRLPPFAAADVRRLVESMAGSLPTEVVEVVERLSEGSPFMAAAVLRGLVESGAMSPDSSGWRVEPAALADARSSRHAAAFLARRMELLPAEAIRLLSIGAVLGREFDLEMAALLAGQEPHQAGAVLKEARRRCIVWSKAEGARYVFFHDKLRETLLARLQEDERRQLHRQTALRLESQGRERVFELAYHFDAAGDSQRALPYALAAAEQSRTQHSLEIAEQQYRIAERADPTDRATRYRIAEGLGDLLILRGRYDEAALKTATARDLAEGEVARAQIEGKLGELAFRRGDVKTAIDAIERALAVLGRKAPQWPASLLCQLLWETIVQGLHTLFPKLFVGHKKREGVEKQLLLIRLHNRLTYAYWFGRGQMACLWTHLRGMNLAERYPPTQELAQAYSIHAPVMSLVGYFHWGAAYAQKSFAIYKSLGDLWGQGQSQHFLGMILYVASRFEESLEKVRAAEQLLQRTGDVWEVNIARYHAARCLYQLGNLRGAVAEAKQLHQSGLELGDIQAMGMCLDVWAQASGGQINPNTVQTELQRPRADVQVSAKAMLAEGVRLFMLDRAEEAAVIIEKALRLVEKAGISNHVTHPLHSWLASALRRQAEPTSNWTPERRTMLLKRARKAAERAVKIGRTFMNDLPHALREAGLVARMQGRIRQARKYLDESLAVAERQGARLEHAQTLLARGRVGLTLAFPGSQEEVATVRRTLLAMGADFALDERPTPSPGAEPATLSLADRFDTVLDAGRRIASALSQETIFTSIREAALKLLRAEECLVLQAAPDGAAEPTPVAGEITGGHSRTMVRRAMATAGVVAFAEGLPEDASESALLSQARSVLCAPIFVRGRPGGCFYVAHRGVSGLFGEDEQRLAEFIATIAGAALENAAGFAELRSLNENLEERVTERSAAVEARSRELARSNAELEQFASIASHDLQEPLRKVQSFGDLLAANCQETVNAEGRDCLKRMQNAAKRMQLLIDDLLSFARITSHAKPFVEIELGRVAKEVVGDLETRIRETRGSVQIGALPRIDADPMQMRQLFQNLIANALKYRQPDHAPTVVVQGRLCGEDGALCEITVRDDGIGFDEKYLDRIFLPFQRLHGREAYEGTGMGLAICRKIVERDGHGPQRPGAGRRVHRRLACTPTQRRGTT